MTQPPLADIAKCAFLAAMKTHATSEAMWIAAADAVVEECAKVADRLSDSASDHEAGAALGIAEGVIAWRPSANAKPCACDIR